MYLHQISTQVIIGPSFQLSDFAGLIKKHSKDFPGVPKLEQQAQNLIAANFEFPLIETYIRDVCRWGNFAGVGGRIIKNNSQEAIVETFAAAYAQLNADEPDPAAALARLNRIHGLGRTSFASKHLRFMKPDICPVYDSILTDKLPYAFDPAGYASFSTDCQDIAGKLNAANIENPGRQTKRWLAADVEAAMFAHFYL